MRQRGLHPLDRRIFRLIGAIRRVEIGDVIILDAMALRVACEAIPDRLINRAGHQPPIGQIKRAQAGEDLHQLIIF